MLWSTRNTSRQAESDSLRIIPQSGCLALLIILAFGCGSQRSEYDAWADTRRVEREQAEERQRVALERSLAPMRLRSAEMRLAAYEIGDLVSGVGLPQGFYADSGASAGAVEEDARASLFAARRAMQREANWEDAVELLERACERGSSRACVLLAFYKCEQTRYSRAEVRQLLEKACERGDPIALLAFADVLWKNQVDGGELTPESLAIEAMEGGELYLSCELLVEIAGRRDPRIDWGKVETTLDRLLAVRGNLLQPAFVAGLLLYSPVERQRTKARALLETRAEEYRARQSTAARPYGFSLGRWLCKQHGPDASKGIEWLELAVQAGSREAAELLISVHLQSDAIPFDRRTAFKWCLVLERMDESASIPCSNVRRDLSIDERAQAHLEADAFAATFFPLASTLSK
jgi:TPR repeat protein